MSVRRKHCATARIVSPTKAGAHRSGAQDGLIPSLRFLPKRLEQALDVAGFEAGAGTTRGVVDSGGERFLALL
jgi:hypothetical protein